MTKDNSSSFVGSGIGEDTTGLMLNSNTSKKNMCNNNNLLNAVNKRSEETLTPKKTLTFQTQTNKHKIMVGMQEYSQTSCKRPPKIQRLSGPLREVVVYKNQTKEGLFREEVQAHPLYT